MFGFIKKGLQKTKEAIQTVVGSEKKEKISKELLEEALLEADLDYDLVEKILDRLPEEVSKDKLKKELLWVFDVPPNDIKFDDKPYVMLIIGVNGAGKTTTIAKLAHKYKSEGKSVILGAADTFRAAAIEQLSKWAEILDVPIIKTKHGHDPAAVAYDTISSAKAKGIDVALIDTAGRLHNKVNLQNELKKIVNVSKKAYENAPHKKILIIDGTQGSSAINQAKVFKELIGADGVIITKLDGTAKGGSVFTIANDLALPIYYVGVGEKPEDLVKFDKEEFVEGILESIYGG
ncbi:signal recognition particle-docking protein FtsY [Caminibacter pacificus]|jgi:fused signal recognition particle receptor|uniref:Signal recognition particle receptor FtsY n=1 Tax=Caminibacter pacificus TaxID=1424653 RepID=A0AAJ4RCI5_9BACT|nr:signal recognition particle-docking protein FtsY [Caminibacter pacificus]QCI27750.1 signal recognition particle-docking protein FtsY [Caminibacter pacificus]ROR40075.1 fused signal recognition particle receptor [Caminibacter pacificus]